VTAKFMARTAFLLGICGIPFVILIAVSSDFTISMAESFKSQRAIYFAALGNLAFGTILILAAPAVKFPLGFRILGIWSLLSAIVSPLLPLEFWISYIDWWVLENSTLYRIVSFPLGFAFCAFIIYASFPRREIDSKQEYSE